MGNVNIDLRPYYQDAHSDYALSPKQVQFRFDHTCSSESPCLLLPCTCCGEALQRWFVDWCHLRFGHISDLAMVCIVPPRFIVPDEKFDGDLIGTATRWFRDLIHRSELDERAWLGGIDISYNSFDAAKLKMWSIHASLLTTMLDGDEKHRLRNCLEVGNGVKVPVKVKAVWDLTGAAHYMMKESFFARNQYIGALDKVRVRSLPLRGAPETRLSINLSQVMHQQRLITVGLRRQGSQLVELKV
jgi:hypothetical protein